LKGQGRKDKRKRGKRRMEKGRERKGRKRGEMGKKGGKGGIYRLLPAVYPHIVHLHRSLNTPSAVGARLII